MLPASESPPKVIICHCTNCKRYTGSSFSANIIVPQSSLQYIKGSPKLYSDRSNKDTQVLRELCPDCGTPFTSRSSDDQEVIAVKSRTLDEEHRLNCAKLAMEIYYHRKDKWVDEIPPASALTASSPAKSVPASKPSVPPSPIQSALSYFTGYQRASEGWLEKVNRAFLISTRSHFPLIYNFFAQKCVPVTGNLSAIVGSAIAVATWRAKLAEDRAKAKETDNPPPHGVK
ncbi:hypothetical protein CBS147333_6628 [Penicillium roqueforti]|nr:hypothetical protein CBS147333_6628 [Penicillium roqueforti]KAI3265221.1 hypothetical protein CBS147308_7623 [Penicillium roqueforti]KAI3287341.1 hypothetical protein DTO003C3_6409 [Penicillium roqueforti]